MNKLSPEELNQSHQDPNHWIWGIFYFNKQDHRLLPPKRNPWMGWTVNFANPKSILLLLAMMLFCSVIVYFTKSK